MEDWNTAGSVEGKHYFQHLHKLSRSLHHPPLKNESANEVKFARLNKKPLFLVAGMVVLIIGTLIFNSILE
jgi:hypothetical protein